MENALKKINKNVRFILKTNNDLAIAFLKSCFGKKLQKYKDFRIISDMNRENEDDSEYAGCNLMRWLRDNNFKNCKKMIFTSD